MINPTGLRWSRPMAEHFVPASAAAANRPGVRSDAADQPDAAHRTAPPNPDPVLCRHCGRTASNGISCEGFCVADVDLS